jgi:outer membrane murein-binding lipoprotein Lpp
MNKLLTIAAILVAFIAGSVGTGVATAGDNSAHDLRLIKRDVAAMKYNVKSIKDIKSDVSTIKYKIDDGYGGGLKGDIQAAKTEASAAKIEAVTAKTNAERAATSAEKAGRIAGTACTQVGKLASGLDVYVGVPACY